MEKFDLYMSSIQTESMVPTKENEKSFRFVGYFVNKKDAENAAKIYEVVYRAMGMKLLHTYKVEKKSFSKNLRLRTTIIDRQGEFYYKSLDEFIYCNQNIKRYLEVNKLTADELLSQINENDSKIEKELRIIERMIKEYNDKLHFALRTSSTSEESIEKIKESIKYLESLREKTTGFTK